MDVRKELLQKLLDIATSSMDHGSGFLDNEEVEALRETAVTLGINPMTVTPYNFKPKYCPGHVWSDWKIVRSIEGAIRDERRECITCETSEDREILLDPRLT